MYIIVNIYLKLKPLQIATFKMMINTIDNTKSNIP